MYMANTSPNARGPNATYIPPACVRLTFGSWGLALGQGASHLVREAFQNAKGVGVYRKVLQCLEGGGERKKFQTCDFPIL